MLRVHAVVALAAQNLSLVALARRGRAETVCALSPERVLVARKWSAGGGQESCGTECGDESAYALSDPAGEEVGGAASACDAGCGVARGSRQCRPLGSRLVTTRSDAPSWTPMSETSRKQHLTAEVVEQSSVTVPTRLKNDRRAVLATLVRGAQARRTHSTRRR